MVWLDCDVMRELDVVYGLEDGKSLAYSGYANIFDSFRVQKTQDIASDVVPCYELRKGTYEITDRS